MTSTAKRPALRYHGGKWKLAPWVISFFPAHQVYVEPFGGACSVLIRKPRVAAEIYNDLDDDVVTLFRVLRDPLTAEALRRRLVLTPFARTELAASYEPAVDRIDAVHKMLIRSFMGFGSASMTRMHITGFRSSSSRSHGRKGSTPAIDWTNWPDHMPELIDRLRGVVIENRDFEPIITQHDSPQTLFYADPPYLQETRSSLKAKNGNRGHYYRHDMTDADHVRLAEVLQGVKGMVVLSGYPSPLYEGLFANWHRVEKKHYADGARARTEVLWLNPACATAVDLGRSQQRLIA